MAVLAHKECGAAVCREGQCGLLCACPCHAEPEPPPLQTSVAAADPDARPPSQISLAAIKFTRPRHRTADALQQIADMATWHYGQVTPPSRAAITRSRELTLALGALHPDGPEGIIMAPSVVGGVSTTFIQDGRDISVCCANDGTMLVVVGQCWFGSLRVWEISDEHRGRITEEIKYIFTRAAEYDTNTASKETT